MPMKVKTVERKCYECGGVMIGRPESYKYTECGLDSVYLSNVCVFRCTNQKCAAIVPEIPAIGVLHREIARNLVMKETLLSGEEIRFLRKMAGLSSIELSNLL